MNFDLLKAVKSTNRKAKDILRVGSRNLEKWICRHISAVGALI